MSALIRSPRLLLATLAATSVTAFAQTYNVTDLGPFNGAPTFATSINDRGVIGGYSQPDANSARAWIWQSGFGFTDAGSLGGANNSGAAVAADGRLYGTSQNAGGVARGFVFDPVALTLTDLGSVAPGDPVSVSDVNAAGVVAGTTTTGGATTGFSLSGGTMTLLGTFRDADLPATSSATAINAAGRVVGVGSWVNGGTRAFRTDSSGNLVSLGTLGGNESTAYAINAAGEVAGCSTFSTSATLQQARAFVYFDGVGMLPLGYLDYYHDSVAEGINDAGDVVGRSVDVNGVPHAVAWLSGGAIRDLNALVPPNAGWTLEEATAIDNGGDIVGHGLVGGQEHAFLLTRYTGPDTLPPVAVATATMPPYAGYTTLNVAVKFWDNEKVVTSTVQGVGAIRVRGPNLYDMPGTCTSWTTLNSQTINAGYTVPAPGGSWGPEDNGTYEIWVAGNRVSDLAGNLMPSQLIGTFTIGYQTAPVLTIAGLPATTMAGTPVSLTLTATGSYPSNAADVFTYAIDWNGDGSDMQTVSGPTNTMVQHSYSITGAWTVRVHCTDPHGAQSADSTAAISVTSPTQQLATSTVVATNVPGVAMNLAMTAAVNGGTMYFFGSGGTNVYTWSYLTPGALPALTGTSSQDGLFAGAAVDSRGRVLTMGGPFADNDVSATTSVRTYPSGGGTVASMPSPLPAATSLSFVNQNSPVTTTDGQGRIYIYSGALNLFYRYTAGTSGAGTWASLPVPPSTSGGICWDGGDQIIIFGATPSVYSISANAWTQPLASPSVFVHAARGVDGLIYLLKPFQVWAYDPVPKTFAQIGTTTYDDSGTAVYGAYTAFALPGTDGFLYLFAASSGNGTTIEKFDTRLTATSAPLISSTPSPTTIVQGVPWTYTIAASGKPRPTFSLDRGPDGMTVDGATGIVSWTPTPAQVGAQSAIFRATNSAGTAAQLITFSVITAVPDTTRPTPPTNVVVSNVTSTTADIAWSPGTDNVGVVAYNLYKKTVLHDPKGSGSRTFYGLVGSTTGTSLHLAGLTPYKAYPYYLTSVDAAGNISTYVAAGFSTTYMSTPGISNGNNGPNAGTYAVVGNAFTSFTFTATGLPTPALSVVSEPAGAAWNAGGYFTWTPVAGQEGTATFTLSAANSSGTFTQSYTVQVYPAGTDFVSPSTPGGFVLDQVGWNSCRATWTASTDNVAVTGYRLTARHLDSRLHAPPYHDQIVSTDVAATVLQTTVTGLSPSTSYDVTAQAFDAAGNVSAPAVAQVGTMPPPFVALPNVAQTPNADGSVTMTWPSQGYSWMYTVQSTDSLDPPNWQPVAPANQWPSYGTSFTITPDRSVPHRFYRVQATPGQ